ncbi:hypothetical protein D9M73_169770 [compost metagenome]
MGSRFPPRVPAAGSAGRTVSACAAHCAYRYGRHANPRGDRSAPAPAGRRALPVEFRPAQHLLPHRAQGGTAQAVDGLSRRASWQRWHRLLPVAQEGRRNRRLPLQSGVPCAAVSRRPCRRDTCGQPAPLSQRGRADHGRYHCFRHGYRQAQRALRCSPRPAQIA